MRDKISKKSCRIIAFYLPQYHPIPENDQWWGKGFTEWTNVAKAKPLYPGHYQPHIPADLGFYDLRVPEARIAQAEMAEEYGIEGFLYWHYWFAGKRILERPYEEMLLSGIPNFPFCLGWANESWTGIWYGAKDKILIEQTYPGKEDYKLHFNYVFPAFSDDRYIKVDNKPLFIIYKPNNIPNTKEFCDYWQHLAQKAGLPGLYLVGISYWSGWIPSQFGLDGAILFNTTPIFNSYEKIKHNRLRRILHNIRHRRNLKQLFFDLFCSPTVIPYKETIKHKINFPANIDPYDYFPVVIPNWDNTPRSGKKGLILEGSTPELFKLLLEQEMEHVCHRPFEKRIIFIKSWNEWAEGNHLEPDLLFGKGYLEIIKETIRSI